MAIGRIVAGREPLRRTAERNDGNGPSEEINAVRSEQSNTERRKEPPHEQVEPRVAKFNLAESPREIQEKTGESAVADL